MPKCKKLTSTDSGFKEALFLFGTGAMTNEDLIDGELD